MLFAIAWFSDADFSEEPNLLDGFVETLHRFVEGVNYSWPKSCSIDVVRLRSGSVAHGGGLIYFPNRMYNALALFLMLYCSLCRTNFFLGSQRIEGKSPVRHSHSDNRKSLHLGLMNRDDRIDEVALLTQG